jgi:outer membrane protein
MIKKTLLILCLYFAFNLEAQNNYSIDELILQAINNSPDLKIAKENLNAAKERHKNAIGSYLPRVDFQAAAGEMGQSRLLVDTMENDSFLLGKLSLSQLLYDFGKTNGNVDRYHYEKEQYNFENIQKISDKIRDVKSAYYTLLRTMALIDVSKENLKLNEAQLYRAQRYFEAGIRTKIDVSDAKVGVVSAKIELNNAKYAKKLAFANLDRVIGLKESLNNYSVVNKKLKLENIYESLIKYDLCLKDSIEYAYKHRAILHKYQASIKASQAKMKNASANYYPALYFNADYTKYELDELQSFIPKDQWQASLNLDWNIYEGGKSKATIQEKKILMQISKSELADMQLRIKEQVTTAYINLLKNRDSVALSQSLLEVSKEKFHQAQKRYENGLSDYIELQQARQGYIQAKSSLVIDYYNYYNSIALLDHAIGR